MKLKTAIDCLLENISEKTVMCMNRLCLDTKKEYWIKIKDKEFEISPQSYETLKEISSFIEEYKNNKKSST